METDQAQVRAGSGLARWRARAVYLAAAVAAGALAWSAVSTHRRASREALADFKAESTTAADLQLREVSATLNRMYEGLRTIARLPGVRNIDRYAKNFSDDARLTVQEIYNNLGTNVAMSEVYIVPLDLQPDLIDPNTHELQAPITTFDEIIVGRTASTPEEGAEERTKVEEIEIYEYRLMRRQLDYLAAHFSDEGSIKGLDYPAVIGPQVVTCDNSRFHPDHPDDQDRSGLVYSVPFYGPDGKLKGCVSGVILTAALGDLLGNGNFAVCAPGYGFFVTSSAQRGTAGSSPLARQAVIDPALPYCESRVLPIVDTMGQWRLWAGRAESELLETDAMRSAVAGLRAGLELAAVVAAALLVIGWLVIGWLVARGLVARGLARTGARAMELEATVRERTKDLNTALQEAAAASRAKSEFLANMSHEIRTPMTAILGYSDLLLAPELSATERIDHVQVIRRNSNHLLAVINDILDLSKIEAGKMTVEGIDVDPVAVVEDAISLLRVRASAKGLALDAVYEFPVPRRIKSDPVRLRQTLLNLIGNAIKFTQTGSVAVVTALTADDPPLLSIAVRDTGIGMTPEQVDSLFRPFSQADASTTRRFGGTGLGLAISRKLAQLLGGDIRVTSEHGKGTSFRLTINPGTLADAPLAHSAGDLQTARSTAAPEADPVGSLRGVHVLLAEDGPDNQRLIRFLLEKAGATLEIVGDGKAAVQRALACGFDVILMDMQMPEMDGYAATSMLRQHGYMGRIVALTAHAMAEDRQRCLGAGCNEYLSKPVNRSALIAACAHPAAAAAPRAA